MIADEVNFCPRCAAKLVVAQRFGKARSTCPHCDWIYFQDPKVAAAVLIEQDRRILLVRRAVNPQKGLWTLPAGFIDAGEDPAEAAQRECYEETGLNVQITGLLDVLANKEHTRGANFVIFYRAEIVTGDLKPGDDVDCADYFPIHELPPLAFATTKQIIDKM